MLLYTSLLETPSLANIEPVVRWDGLTYGNYADVRAEDLLLDVPQAVRTGNASWWMDVVLVKDGGTVKGRQADEVALYRKRALPMGVAADLRTHSIPPQEASKEGEEAYRRRRIVCYRA